MSDSMIIGFLLSFVVVPACALWPFIVAVLARRFPRSYFGRLECRKGFHDWRPVSHAEVKEAMRTRKGFLMICRRCGCKDGEFDVSNG